MNSRISVDDKWLFEKVGDDPNPIFALPSSLNWIQSLSYEINSTYGVTYQLQTDHIADCSTYKNISQLSDFSRLDVGDTFGSLFGAITYTLALESLLEVAPDKAWVYPSAIIQWYYSIYNSLRSINLCQTLNKTDTHSGLTKSLNQFSQLLPHPFNMLAEWEENEKYICKLPEMDFSEETNLYDSFTPNERSCCGMIIKYLKGTAAWEMDYKKEELKYRYKLDSFRTKEAKQIRDQYCLKKINFMNCAFRYRGKANYRDTLFLTYGMHDSRFNGLYMVSLFNIARFMNIAAIEFLRKRLNDKIILDFTSDITKNLRHIEKVPKKNRFWDQSNLY